MAFPPKKPRGAFNPRFKKEQQQEHRTNHLIRAMEVRLVGDNVTPGVYSIQEAQQIANNLGMDLVEISPGANPPVCRAIDYNKFLYEEKKKKKEIKAKSKTSEVKEIRFTPNTDDHDFEFKVKHAEKFLLEGDKVKAHVQFKGRAIMFKERGELLLLKFADRLKEVGALESMPKMEGKRMLVMFAPKTQKKKAQDLGKLIEKAKVEKDTPGPAAE
ncbi:MAG TPA: translation initiation factor IF-3 [Ferruginibacter sp.]|nr:translation initiation factor IF-3 [Ferruginibacter sp.]HRN91931.1 translation initiation factor IF-3 [Ferruginibacter sp.]HRO05546.1 translation initiation factor IF-3 [Ferruginibacter sp.]HRO96296.1 translation initiation factor IF-3 [Ferruginibacter sp.]HRP49410.1 translation initiation factor IF-3 [Ferruginibacter sp.]